ncbi:MAG TPA: LysR substrate-binding domain-containing protein [Bosea sp. (in: a-proteobacteria)]|jgi:LysR family hydrogen peroxide-inducible transcriptional activator|uniref:hydrogen peroxide-inducible genes activator n=1 Tax=Bosea sp. (in: a-proteobacteria) TaxID=1871050 RepID=UPI002DDD1454|nr:LysR substrate-binding domain-containing protein [Bosea sp. (in: a-proteobacteria)]HEV2554566.1 LysR substrate-binding domain-containing protein [Bosea sp. (in: a-proteobacteria)]
MAALSIRHLRYFDALARQGHFGRAAEHCAISQPALSLQIKDLEDSLGVTLVERSAKQIRLTALGEEFALRGRDILRAIDELADLARASRGPLAGRLRIGVIPTVAPYLLPRFIKALVGRYPDVELSPREALTRILIEDLVGGRLDAAIVALPASEPSLAETPLFEEEFVLVRSRDEAARPVPSTTMLREMRLLLLEEGHCFREQALEVCAFSPQAPRALMEGSSLSTLVQMVGAGIGVTLIPEMAVAVEIRSAAVSVARLGAPRPSRTIGMVWRKTNPLAAQLAEIATMVREAGLAAMQDAAQALEARPGTGGEAPRPDAAPL